MIIIYQRRSFYVDTGIVVLVEYLNINFDTVDMHCPFLKFHNLWLKSKISGATAHACLRHIFSPMEYIKITSAVSNNANSCKYSNSL